jgi:hypothetical protein
MSVNFCQHPACQGRGPAMGVGCGRAYDDDGQWLWFCRMHRREAEGLQPAASSLDPEAASEAHRARCRAYNMQQAAGSRQLLQPTPDC